MTSELSHGAALYALLGVIKSSPIFVRLAGRVLYASDWASMRKSAHVDAFVLAWIASHVHEPRQGPRRFT
jgi:hypothetical protein